MFTVVEIDGDLFGERSVRTVYAVDKDRFGEVIFLIYNQPKPDSKDVRDVNFPTGWCWVVARKFEPLKGVDLNESIH